jgi:hypothetical protein
MYSKRAGICCRATDHVRAATTCISGSGSVVRPRRDRSSVSVQDQVRMSATFNDYPINQSRQLIPDSLPVSEARLEIV